MRARKRDRSGESGQSLVELALVAPILILLLMAIFQFAFIFETQMGLTNAVREAARRAATTTNPTAAWVRSELCGPSPTACDAGLLDENVQGFSDQRLTTLNIEFQCYLVGGQPNYRVDIDLTYDHPEFFPLAEIAALAAGHPSSGSWAWAASANGQMRLERGAPPVYAIC